MYFVETENRKIAAGEVEDIKEFEKQKSVEEEFIFNDIYYSTDFSNMQEHISSFMYNFLCVFSTDLSQNQLIEKLPPSTRKKYNRAAAPTMRPTAVTAMVRLRFFVLPSELPAGTNFASRIALAMGL